MREAHVKLEEHNRVVQAKLAALNKERLDREQQSLKHNTAWPRGRRFGPPTGTAPPAGGILFISYSLEVSALNI